MKPIVLEILAELIGGAIVVANKYGVKINATELATSAESVAEKRLKEKAAGKQERDDIFEGKS